LRFASVTVTNFRKDFHLQVDARAGRTERSRFAAAVVACWERHMTSCPSLPAA
jgi:hypothetical protein